MKVFEKMPDSDYFAHPAVSQSDLKQILKSPAHYLNYKLGPKEPPTPQMKFGTAFHTMALEPETMDERVIFTNLNKRTKAFDEFEMQHKGKILLTEEDKNTLNGMIWTLQRHQLAQDALKGAKVEQTLMWTDEVTGIALKCKVDALNDDYVIDLKTTKSAREDDFTKSIFNDDYRYYFQAAFYVMGLKAVTGKDYKFKFIAIEKEQPYGIGVFELSDNAMFKAKMEVRKCLDVLSACVKSNTYPGYPTETKTIDWPRWR